MLQNCIPHYKDQDVQKKRRTQRSAPFILKILDLAYYLV